MARARENLHDIQAAPNLSAVMTETARHQLFPHVDRHNLTRLRSPGTWTEVDGCRTRFSDLSASRASRFSSSLCDSEAQKPLVESLGIFPLHCQCILKFSLYAHHAILFVLSVLTRAQVGAGPSGLILALSLLHHGIPVRIIENCRGQQQCKLNPAIMVTRNFG
jgi:hypothetical protein